MFEVILGLAGTAMLGSIGWLFMEVSDAKSKVAVLEQKDSDLKELLSEVLDAKLEGVNFRLERIEKAMNGALRGH